MKRVEFRRAQDWPRGNYGPRNLVAVTYKGHEYVLNTGHGTDDDVNVWRSSGGYFHVLTRNRGLNYVGAADFGIVEHRHVAHDPEHDLVEPLSSKFVQVDHEIESVFGRYDAVTHFDEVTLYRRMAPYLQS